MMFGLLGKSLHHGMVSDPFFVSPSSRTQASIFDTYILHNHHNKQSKTSPRPTPSQMTFLDIYWAFSFTSLAMAWRRRRQAMAKWRLGRRKWRGPGPETDPDLGGPDPAPLFKKCPKDARREIIDIHFVNHKCVVTYGAIW